MNANRYMRGSLRTADRSNMDRLKLECALGLCGEAGEVAEQVKKHFFHGHELDKCHMIEELGDVAWYLAVLCDAIGSDLDTVMEENLKKLVVLTLVLLLMAVAEYFSIDPVWFLIVWYLSDNISA